MTSEIRVNKLHNRVGLGTVEYTNTGIVVSGIVTCTELSGLTALNIAGVGTANTLDINGDIDVDGHTNLDNVSIVGVTTITGTSPTINFEESDGNPNYRIIGEGGALYFQALPFGAGASGRLTLHSAGNVQVNNNLDVGAGIDVTGNATVSGDIDVDGHTNLDNVSVAGVTTFTGSVTHGSSINLGGELNFTGNGHKYIDVATLNGSNTLTIRHQDGGSYQTAAYFDANGGGYLQFNGNTKFATTNTGVNITGTAVATTFVGALTGTASGNPTLANGANNRVITATGANALTGESNFTYNGTQVDIAGTTDGVLNLDTTDSRGAFIRFGQGGSYHNMVGSADGLVTGLDKQDLAVRAFDNFAIATNGDNERLRIVSTGQVQLNGATGKSTSGTSATDLLLANGAAIRFRRANDSNWINTIGIDSSDNLKLGWGGSVDEIHFGIAGIGQQMTLDSSGNLLIGRTAWVDNHFDNGIYLAGSTQAGMKFMRTASGSAGTYDIGIDTDRSFKFVYAGDSGGTGTERLRISSNGDVRIGSGTPATFGTGTTVHETYNANTYVANLVTSGTHQLQMIASQTHGATSIGTRSNHNLNLCANDSTKVTITTDGEVRIATRNSANGGELGFRFGSFGIRTQDVNGYNWWRIDRNYGGWKSDMISLRGDGHVGINTDNPSKLLTIQGGDLAVNEGRLYLSSDRDAAVPGASFGYQVISGYKEFSGSNTYVGLAYVGHSHSIMIQYMCVEGGNTALGGSHGEIYFHTTYGNSQNGVAQQAHTVAMNGGRITSGVSFQYCNSGCGSHGNNYVLRAKVSYSGSTHNFALHYTIKGVSAGNMYT